MTIRDNGFTFVKSVQRFNIVSVDGFTIVIDTKCLADLEDWLAEALEEVRDKIQEDWEESRPDHPYSGNPSTSIVRE